MNTDEQILREKIVESYREVVQMGLTDQASGNLSVRIDGGMLISCSGATAENLTTERVVRVSDDASFDGMGFEGKGSGELKPSSEWRMHQAIYQRHEKAGAVVHTHSDYCVALACHNQPLPGFHYMVGTFGGNDVPCVPYSTFGTEQLAGDAADALTDRSACLLGNHGMICRGPDLATAVATAERMEILCRHYVLARQLGEPNLLSDAEWDEFHDRYQKVTYGKFI